MAELRKPLTAACDGRALDAVVRELFEASWGKARGWIETGKVFVDGAAVRDPRAPVRFSEGSFVELKPNAPRNPRASSGNAEAVTESATRALIVHSDTQVVVARKPPGISTVPFDEAERDTLLARVCRELRVRSLEVVHRIDKETSGLVVFARNPDAARKLAQQFRFHTVHRRYFALAHGDVGEGTFRSVLVENRGDGLRGSAPAHFRVAEGEGKEAVTHVRRLERVRGATLVECRLETGRTHQIRIHLSEDGHPLVGEKLYVREFREPLLAAPRLLLHAAELGFVHPARDAPMLWREPMPDDFRLVLESLRG